MQTRRLIEHEDISCRPRRGSYWLPFPEPLKADLAQGWGLLYPFDPSRAEAALEDLQRVAPRTVVWLNEAQHYFGDRAAGGRIAAAVQTLFVQPERGPVLVLGTLWHDSAKEYSTLPTPGKSDPHNQV